MRPSCTLCARKHLAQALILMNEARMGYPEHRWLAIGHLAEASDELLKEYPDLANQVRDERKRYESDPAYQVPIMSLIELVGRGDATIIPAPAEPVSWIGTVRKLREVDKHIEQMSERDREELRRSFEGRHEQDERRRLLDEMMRPTPEQMEARMTNVDELRRTNVPTMPMLEMTPAPRVSPHTLSGAKPAHPPAPVVSAVDMTAHGPLGVAGPVKSPIDAIPGRVIPPFPHSAVPAASPASLVPDAKINIPLAITPPAQLPQVAPCLTCGDKGQLQILSNLLTKEPERPRLVFLTTLSNFNPSYSLTSVLMEQAHAAIMAGYRVIILVFRGCDLKQLPMLPPEITVLSIVPVMSWREDVIKEDDVSVLVQSMTEWFRTLVPTHSAIEPIHVITLDLLFQSWFVSFAKAIHTWCAPEPTLMFSGDGKAERNILRSRVRWFHTAHSSVGARPVTIHPDAKFLGDRSAVLSADDEALARARWYRCTLPPEHTLLALNYADVPHLKAYYRTLSRHDTRMIGGPDDGTVSPAGSETGIGREVVTLLNPKDVRPFTRMSITASQLTTKYGLHLADVTMIYPLSMERVQEKGIGHVLALLGAMKRLGLIVRLLLITANAQDTKAKELITWTKSVAQTHELLVEGLPTLNGYQPDVILTCEALPGTQASGLGADDVRALWSVSNLFIFPTVSEAGSLVLLEAALAGCTLVLNQSLPCLADYIPADQALWVPWGSLKGAGNPPTSAVELDELAGKVWDRMHEDRGGVLRRHIMRKHSLEVHGADLNEILRPEPLASGWTVQVTRLKPEGLPPGWNEPDPAIEGQATDAGGDR